MRQHLCPRSRSTDAYNGASPSQATRRQAQTRMSIYGLKDVYARGMTTRPRDNPRIPGTSFVPCFGNARTILSKQRRLHECCSLGTTSVIKNKATSFSSVYSSILYKQTAVHPREWFWETHLSCPRYICMPCLLTHELTRYVWIMKTTIFQYSSQCFDDAKQLNYARCIRVWPNGIFFT